MGLQETSSIVGDMAMTKYVCSYEKYTKIPGTPIAYWVSDSFSRLFENKRISDYAEPRHGMSTGNNDLCLKLWHEVKNKDICFDAESKEDFDKKKGKYAPYKKGGEFRLWYGNNDYVIAYSSEARKRMESLSGYRSSSTGFFFKPSITWSDVSSSNFGVRTSSKGFAFDGRGASMFCSEEDRLFLLGLLASKVTTYILNVLNPTLTFNINNVAAIPVIVSSKRQIEELVLECVNISKEDWDAFDISWDFRIHPLVGVGGTNMGRLISDKYQEWEKECQDRFNTLKSNEEKLNRIFIDIYGLQDELTPEVEDKDVSVRLADRERDVKSLISYLIGIVMGRYSLDVPGLAYAGGEWDSSKYKTYHPDDDGIVPIYRGIGMEDGLTAQLILLLKLIYGDDTYRQNIDFIAESIGRNNNESSEEALNRYLNDGFFADHLKVYQKRPIYWLFSSGKNSGFKCLIYLHRYHNDTLARINSRYFLPESTRLKNDLEELNGRLAKAEGRDRVRLEKERQKLAASYNEAIEYGQVLDHMANQYIEIDLDDGVKTNYAKFQSVEMVTDSGNKVKKDLLAPIK
jgi:type II restriction/modification system DNA methylase subunit YeeA